MSLIPSQGVAAYDSWQGLCIHASLPLLLLHPFNGLFSRTTWVSRYQKGKTSLHLNEARYDGVLWIAAASAGPYANNLQLAPDR